jgi:DNA-binding FadR family transcriptional regulator
MTANKISHKSLVDQVVEAVVELIDAEDLRPGDRLPSTAHLIGEFGVSRPVVREALKALEGRGVIDISSGRTAIVRPMDSEPLQSFFQRAVALEDENLLEILEVRHGIEVQSARLAAARRTHAELAALQAVTQKMRDSIGSSEEYTELDVEFHLKIAGAAHNRMLYFLVESIRDVLRDTIEEGLRHRLTEEERQLVQSTHEEILASIEKQDADGAAKAMAFHFTDAIRAIFYAEGADV